MSIKAQDFNWSAELEKTVAHSLTTSFGLDFLLFKDKLGGDVDTIHNARQGIYATNQARLNYEQRESYNSHDYHSHKNYIAQGRVDKQAQQAGSLNDNYRNQKMGYGENRQLDHTISASEIHNDAGRVLSGLSGVELANQQENLNSTHWYINNLKRDHSVEKFVNEIAPKKLNELNQQITKDKARLASMPTATPKQRDEKRQMEAKLNKDSEKAEALNVAIKNKDSMLRADQKARDNYNRQINYEYYTSSKFLANSAYQAGLSGLKMGTRQAVGLVLAEMWFELKESIPSILRKHKNSFDFGYFMSDIKNTISSIFERVKLRFKEIISTFKDNFLSGILSSISTTLINIFTTTARMAGKIIREMWSSLIQAAKLIFFNPDKLSLGELTKQVLKIISGGVAIIIGSVVNIELNKVLSTLPFGNEISAFLSALLSGVITLGISYFLEYSELMKKVWNALDNFFKNKYDLLLEEFQRLTKELDQCLEEIARIELNLDVQQLKAFNDSLLQTSDEYSRSKIIKKELERQKIEAPYEAGNIDAMTDWLISLRK